MDTVVQWNIRGFRSNFEELKLLLNPSQSAVVTLQECRLREGQSRPEVTLCFFRRGRGGLLHQKWNPFFGNCFLTLGCMLQLPQLAWKKTLTVCSLYLPPNSPVSKLSLAELFEQPPKPFLVLGDFNAHSPAWGDSRRDGRGRMLEE
ncbi:RNA-directed DNA polymerase from transposon x-element [Plakobranchus ocellatus]|uniref:RNA-directed DNA polymerase from transposon x-element n=1 Tax=Plakobranchus ocellatus TaxID=259542 RepID=A0AAV3YXX4_9GAST|nr:RNA-directed DNA polymerase from transposon x-element [Plakobranchus ocellatus]